VRFHQTGLVRVALPIAAIVACPGCRRGSLPRGGSIAISVSGHHIQANLRFATPSHLLGGVEGEKL